jgi:uncharacterized repeat protein (TIGR01451 family)
MMNHGGFRMKRCMGIAAWLLLALLYAPMIFAQNTIQVGSVETGAFPVISADVVVRQSGVIIRSTDSSNFTLKEDGFMQAPLQLVHPVATKNFNLVIVLGIGSTMSAGDVAFAKGLANRLVDRMDGVLDEVGVITYDDNPFEQQQMTAIKPVLHSRIDAITPSGRGNYLWDGGYSGLTYLLNNSIHPSRSVLILSNGRNDGGSRNVQQVVDLAKTTNIKVHCYGINAVNNDAEMKFLCQESGGTYWTNTDVMVQQFIDELNGTPEASTLSYTSNNVCRDGEDRSLNVQVKLASDSVNTTNTFPLTANASGNVTVTLKTDTATVVSGKTKNVALMLTPPVQNQRLYGGTITLSFDTSKLQLQGVETAGHLTAGMNASVAMEATGAVITLAGTVALNGGSTLAMLTFMGGTVQANTNVQVQIAGTDFDRGCLAIQPGSARITVRPQSASMSTKSQPFVFNWDDTNNRYNPDPATVTVEVTNNGDLPLSGISAEMAESNDVRIAYGGSRTVQLVPSTLQPGDKGIATWLVQALPHGSETTAQVDVQFTSTEGTSAQQRLFMNIKAASSAVVLHNEVDDIAVVGGVYTPDPAEVRAEVVSAGTGDSPSGDVTIVLPTGVTLDGGPTTQSFASMPRGASTTLRWPLRYPRPSVQTDYAILLIRTAAGHANDTSHVTLTVPVLTSALLDVTCSMTPDGVDSTVTEVTYAVTVRNTGNANAVNVAASLILPVGFVFASGEVAAKAVADPLAPGADGTVNWKLVPVVRQYCEDEAITVGVLVNQTGGASAQCGAPVTFLATNNLLPEIRTVTPVALDTMRTDSNISFDVDAFDTERSVLKYEWFVNGASEGSDARAFDRTFTTEGDYTVRVDIYDACTANGGQAVSHTWQVYIYNTTGITNPAAASDLAIVGNYPNPFNPGTVIEYRLPEAGSDLRLEVLDASGRLMRTLVSGSQTGGTHRITFDAAALPSGSYLVRLTAGGAVRTHRIMLVK